MQKKLYLINESEKERILNLHETRTKKQYLLTEGINRKDFNDGIRKICKGRTSKYNPETMDGWVDYFVGTIGVTKIFSPYTNDDINTISNAMSGLGNIESFCGLAQNYSKKRGGNVDLLEDLASKIKKDDAWKKAVQEPLTKLQNTGGLMSGILGSHNQKIKLQKELTDKGWKEEYKCVVSYNNIKITYNDSLKKNRVEFVDQNNVKSVFYDTGAYYQEINGVEYPKQDDVYYSYSCKGNSPIPTKQLVNINNQPLTNNTPRVIQGFGLVTTNVKSKIPELLKSAGIEGTELNQNTIDALYNKLLKKKQ